MSLANVAQFLNVTDYRRQMAAKNICRNKTDCFVRLFDVQTFFLLLDLKHDAGRWNTAPTSVKSGRTKRNINEGGSKNIFRNRAII